MHVSPINVKAMAHVALPLVVTTINATALTIVKAITVSTSSILVSENVVKEKLVLDVPFLNPMDGTVQPPPLSVWEVPIPDHMTTVAPPLAVQTATVPVPMLATTVNVGLALLDGTALMWTTVRL